MVGTSGITLERFSPLVASARMLPLAVSSAMVLTASNIICTWPPSTSERAAPLVL